jgi:hypothetical protein
MSMEWKILTRGDAAAQFPVLYATLNPAGAIVIGRAAFERMGEPSAFVVMFDPLRHRLGIKAAAAGEPNAYPARKYGQSGAKIIRANRMLKEFGVRPPNTLEFPEAKIDDGVLILDLQTARTSPRAHSRCRYERVVKLESPFPFVN